MPKKKVGAKKGGAKKRSPKKGGAFGIDTDKLLNVVGNVQQSGVLGNVASIIDPKAGAVIKAVGYGRRKKGGMKYSIMPVNPPFQGPRLMPVGENLTGSGKKGSVKRGKGWQDILSSVVNLPLSAAAGATIGLSQGLNAGIHGF